MPDDSDAHWNNFKTALKQHPPTADRIARAIYNARATLDQNEAPIIDELLNAIYRYIFFADATHHMFWMHLRGILNLVGSTIRSALPPPTYTGPVGIFESCRRRQTRYRKS